MQTFCQPFHYLGLISKKSLKTEDQCSFVYWLWLDVLSSFLSPCSHGIHFPARRRRIAEDTTLWPLVHTSAAQSHWVAAGASDWWKSLIVNPVLTDHLHGCVKERMSLNRAFTWSLYGKFCVAENKYIPDNSYTERFLVVFIFAFKFVQWTEMAGHHPWAIRSLNSV